jgi:NlpC/P60 family
MVAYVLKAEDLDEPKRFDESHLREVLRERLPWGTGPWHLRVLRDGEVARDWGPFKPREEFVTSALARLEEAEPGDVLQTESQEKEKFRIRVAKLSDTPLERLRELAWSLVGSAYKFGDLDCSGYVRRCIEYATDGSVVLSQAARLQQHDPDVHTFTDETKAKRFDLLFMWFENTRGIVKPSASHVGFYLKPGLMLDTRSETDPVSTSAIEPGGVLEFGRIAAINGPL